MKKEFIILKDNPKVEIELTRDSVCMGDDIDAPHFKEIIIHSFVDPVVLVENIYLDYLPKVNGNSHTWDCYLNDQHIANISNTGVTAKVKEVILQQKNKLNFKYNSVTY